jgi:spermidine synthase
MTNQEWIDGAFTESETDYKIAGLNILYKEEKEYIKKGVELLCDKLHPNSVLEFGFGMGWTATEFQEQGVTRHVILEPNKEVYQIALDWKDKYNSDIEIVNAFSWEFETDERFDLVYDDRLEAISEEKHEKQMKKILPIKQWYSGNAIQTDNRKISDYPMFFQIDGVNYAQALLKYGEYKKWQQ